MLHLSIVCVINDQIYSYHAIILIQIPTYYIKLYTGIEVISFVALIASDKQ